MVPASGPRPVKVSAYGDRQTRNSWTCASRRVARIAAQPSTGKIRKATASRVSGQNTASVTAAIRTRWTSSSTRRAAARRPEWLHHEREHDQLGGQGREERHQARDRGVVGVQPERDQGAAAIPQSSPEAAVTAW